MIDLHSHTTASDGQHSPTALLELAARAGVSQLAVTDHDTVAGLEEAERAAAALGVTLINGIELSAFVNRREVHILGHFLDRTNVKLQEFSVLLRRERADRMTQMVEKMRGLGFPISLEQVEALAGDAQLGRPHLARILVERGWVRSMQEAFDRFLGDGKPAWVDRYRLPGDEAIRLIRDAGGTATLAHPGVSRVERHELAQLREQGLSGVEVFHSDHNPSLRAKYLAIASELKLVPTAGSDFHGEKVAPGRLLGSAAMPPEHLAELRARAAPASA